MKDVAVKEVLFKEAKAKILNVLKMRGEATIDEITAELPIAKTTVRQHLLALKKQGLLETETDRDDAPLADSEERTTRSQGRPSRVYKLSKHSDSLFPNKEPEMLRGLLEQLIQDGRTDWVMKFFENYWDQKAQKFKARVAGQKKDKSLYKRVLFEMLTEEGFMPEIIEDQQGRLSVRECNCPFAEAVKATRIPCQLEAQFLNEVLNQNFDMDSHILDGDYSCHFVGKK